jgi:hypothetical protein
MEGPDNVSNPERIFLGRDGGALFVSNPLSCKYWRSLFDSSISSPKLLMLESGENSPGLIPEILTKDFN